MCNDIYLLIFYSHHLKRKKFTKNLYTVLSRKMFLGLEIVVFCYMCNVIHHKDMDRFWSNLMSGLIMVIHIINVFIIELILFNDSKLVSSYNKTKTKNVDYKKFCMSNFDEINSVGLKTTYWKCSLKNFWWRKKRTMDIAL